MIALLVTSPTFGMGGVCITWQKKKRTTGSYALVLCNKQ